jgi:hypothetical protein
MNFSLITQTNVYTSGCEVLSTTNQLLGEKSHEVSPQVVRISQSFRGCWVWGQGHYFSWSSTQNLIGFRKTEINSSNHNAYLNLCFSVSPKCSWVCSWFFYARSCKDHHPIHPQVIWEFFNCYMLIFYEATGQLLLSVRNSWFCPLYYLFGCIVP